MIAASDRYMHTYDVYDKIVAVFVGRMAHLMIKSFETYVSNVLYSASLCIMGSVLSSLILTHPHPPWTKWPPFRRRDIFKYIFMNEKVCILLHISLKSVPEGVIRQHRFR